MAPPRKLEEMDNMIQAFEKVRESGRTNMFDAPTVTRLMNAILKEDKATPTEVEEMLIRFMEDDDLYTKCKKRAGI